MIGWFDELASKALRRTRYGDNDDVAVRVSIGVSSIEDARIERDFPPAPVAGWRYESGSWLRWSELDGAYRPAPVPMSLFTFTNSIGTPREGLTVALVDGAWQEVTSGAAPLHEKRSVPDPAAVDGQPAQLPTGSSPSVPVGRPVQSDPSTASAPVEPDPAEARARAEATTKAQIEAWRRRRET